MARPAYPEGLPITRSTTGPASRRGGRPIASLWYAQDSFGEVCLLRPAGRGPSVTKNEPLRSRVEFGQAGLRRGFARFSGARSSAVHEGSPTARDDQRRTLRRGAGWFARCRHDRAVGDRRPFSTGGRTTQSLQVSRTLPPPTPTARGDARGHRRPASIDELFRRHPRRGPALRAAAAPDLPAGLAEQEVPTRLKSLRAWRARNVLGGSMISRSSARGCYDQRPVFFGLTRSRKRSEFLNAPTRLPIPRYPPGLGFVQ